MEHSCRRESQEEESSQESKKAHTHTTGDIQTHIPQHGDDDDGSEEKKKTSSRRRRKCSKISPVVSFFSAQAWTSYLKEENDHPQH
jgi:hypothetical protein